MPNKINQNIQKAGVNKAETKPKTPSGKDVAKGGSTRSRAKTSSKKPVKPTKSRLTAKQAAVEDTSSPEAILEKVDRKSLSFLDWLKDLLGFNSKNTKENNIKGLYKLVNFMLNSKIKDEVVKNEIGKIKNCIKKGKRLDNKTVQKLAKIIENAPAKPSFRMTADVPIASSGKGAPPLPPQNLLTPEEIANLPPPPGAKGADLPPPPELTPEQIAMIPKDQKTAPPPPPPNLLTPEEIANLPLPPGAQGTEPKLPAETTKSSSKPPSRPPPPPPGAKGTIPPPPPPPGVQEPTSKTSAPTPTKAPPKNAQILDLLKDIREKNVQLKKVENQEKTSSKKKDPKNILEKAFEEGAVMKKFNKVGVNTELGDDKRLQTSGKQDDDVNFTDEDWETGGLDTDYYDPNQAASGGYRQAQQTVEPEPEPEEYKNRAPWQIEVEGLKKKKARKQEGENK